MKRIWIALFCLISVAATSQVDVYKYTHVTQATANNPIATQPVKLHTVVINASTSGTLAIVDTVKSDCSGGAVITGTGSFTAGQYVMYDVYTKNGLCVVTGGTIDATISWR